MKFQKNDLIETPRGLGIIDHPMEDTCLVLLSPKYNPNVKYPCEFAIFENRKLKLFEDAENDGNM